MPGPREAPLLAPPPGGSAIRPRVSIGVDGHVRLDRRVDRGLQLRLVVDAGLADAAGKVDQRFLLGKRRQHARRLLDRGQLLVGVEDVELGLVGHERAPVSSPFSSPVSARSAISLISPMGRPLIDPGQHVAIVGEIGHHLDRAGVEQDRHHVVLGDASVQVLQRGFLRAQLLGDPSRRSRRRTPSAACRDTESGPAFRR